MKNRYHFYYWPLPFRGNYVRNLFAYSGTPHDETNSFDEIVEFLKCSVADQPSPFMGPPLLVDNEKNISFSQMSAIVFYLGDQLALMPEDILQKTITIKVLDDCTDLLSEITRANGAQMWSQSQWDQFVSTRFVRWLQIFERTAHLNKMTDATFYFGAQSAGVADLALNALFATMERCLPQLSPTLRQHAKIVMAASDRVGENAGIQKMVAAQSNELGDLYCGGEIEKSIRAMLKS